MLLKYTMYVSAISDSKLGLKRIDGTLKTCLLKPNFVELVLIDNGGNTSELVMTEFAMDNIHSKIWKKYLSCLICA